MKFPKLFVLFVFLSTTYTAIAQKVTLGELLRLRTVSSEELSNYYSQRGWSSRDSKYPATENNRTTHYVYFLSSNDKNIRNGVTLYEDMGDRSKNKIQFFTSSRSYYDAFSSELKKSGVVFQQTKTLGVETYYSGEVNGLTVKKIVANLKEQGYTFYTFQIGKE